MALAAQQNDYFNLVNNKPEPKEYHLEKQHTHQVISLLPASNERPRSISQTQSNSFSSIQTVPEESVLTEDLMPKRHSTSFNLAPASSFKKSQKKTRNTLARNYTTGAPDQDVSEEFQKELTARRKTFKRLSKRRPDDQEDRVLMGTLISEGHQNYILMYNMLTGIRIAVGRVSAKPDRPIVDSDFSAAHKLAFDVTGDELTPGAKYDFKFKDYAPWVFRALRERFGIDPADYLISLTSKYILSELGSPGKSGSFFYYSRDYRFIIKTIHHTEHKFMRKILKEYHDHVSSNPDTLLCRYYGLHRVKLPHGRKIHFVVMGNVLPPNKDIHETYDLKGSTLGRFLPEEEIKKNPYAVMKDLNWEKRGNKLQLGPQKRKLFITQLLRDVKLLVRMNIMDYSLMIGVHDIVRGNKDNVRNSTLQFFQPDTKLAERRASMMKRRESKAMVYRKVIMEANPDRLNASELPDTPFDERRNCAFYADDGGFQATDERNRAGPALYFLGIIDILTPYDMKKKSEHFFKSLTQDKNAISSVKPKVYGNRFMGFMSNALEHNEDIPHEYQLESNEKKNL
ncbi:uncharacterized protein EV154DRAFT_498809 [Mucor mucedo]|uniref:1-phosphatidylinositol-4-phosphate 5-kinase n=1 Tax=Mucor saturninus TaxID=64648 RepID=A0A8H7RMA2_9FUNG|nr:uncharacterized protein EV154DRAFT_498809 [Mucor mucedo]KAG2212248.1 hypothetical protein INT47_001607 [Mucor saturninus]KAI7894470.1 hypothetical protein EV154DRAFT_498809 [Mucor mucedo]